MQRTRNGIPNPPRKGSSAQTVPRQEDIEYILIDCRVEKEEKIFTFLDWSKSWEKTEKVGMEIMGNIQRSKSILNLIIC